MMEILEQEQNMFDNKNAMKIIKGKIFQVSQVW